MIITGKDLKARIKLLGKVFQLHQKQSVLKSLRNHENQMRQSRMKSISVHHNLFRAKNGYVLLMLTFACATETLPTTVLGRVSSHI